MSMCSPEGYIEKLKEKPYEEFIKKRDEFIHKIRHFKKHKEEIMNSEETLICTSPETH